MGACTGCTAACTRSGTQRSDAARRASGPLSWRAASDAILSHFAAAVWWGFWAWEERLIDVTITGCGTRKIDGVRVHCSRGAGSPRRAVARRHPRHDARAHPAGPRRDPAREGAARASCAARRPRAPSRSARSTNCSHRSNGHRGAAQLRAVIADGPAPTRTELEDLLLDLLDSAGIERPEINAPLRFGTERIIPDYLWRAQRLAIEADSVTWHEHKLTREHDAEKQALLEAAGLRVLRITHNQITRQPQQTLARIRAALGES